MRQSKYFVQPARPSKPLALAVCLGISLVCGHWLWSVVQGADVTWRGGVVTPDHRPFYYWFKVLGFATMTLGWGGLFVLNVVLRLKRLLSHT